MTQADTPKETAPQSHAETSRNLKQAGGSNADVWNYNILNAVLATIFHPPTMADDTVAKRQRAALAGMQAFKPADEIEGMMAAQATAMHLAAMECFRRAMHPQQPEDIASKLRRDGANLARGMTEMADALERKRGRVSQQVRVEHVHVHDGGQAIVGSVTAGGAFPKPQ